MLSNRNVRKPPPLLLLNDNDQDVECDLEIEGQEAVAEMSHESDDVEAML